MTYSIKRPHHHALCDHPGCRAQGIQCQRLDPLNWHPEFRRLCAPHRKQLGFHPIDYYRGPYSGGRSPGA